MRSALLPSQVLENDFIEENANPKGDFERNMKERIIGGFGFPTPNAHLQTPHSPINTIDITQGAVQAICEFTKHIITETELGIQINLLFSWENELGKVESFLPKEGRIVIHPKKPLNILVRIPKRIEPGSLRAEVNGKEIKGIKMGEYLLLPNKSINDEFVVTFALQRYDAFEFVYHKPYQVSWFGEQVIAIKPVSGIYPLFGEW